MSPRSLGPPGALLAAFLAGIWSLALETLWARMLSVETGGPVAALAIVIGAFMLGLTAGAALLGRLADRTARPWRVFGLLQAGVALCGLISWLAARGGGLSRPVVVWLGAEPSSLLFTIARILTFGSFVAAAALLMGGTLPLLVRAAAREESGDGRLVGLLAGANAAGAALGALLCGFVLLPRRGLSGSLLAITAGALATGVAALAAGRAAPAGPPRQAGPPPARSPFPADAWRVLGALAVCGVAVTALEVVWARIATLTFGSSSQAGSLVLAAVIAGLAAGYTAGAWPGRWRDPDAELALLPGAAALAVLATDPLLGRLPAIAARMSIGTGRAASFLLTFAVAFLPCLLLGAAFPVACRAIARAAGGRAGIGRVVGAASAALSAGNLLGVPLALFVLLPHGGSRACLLVCATLLAVWSLAGAPLSRSGRRARLTGLIALLLIAALRLTTSWDPGLMSSGPYLYASLYGENLETALRARGEVILSREGADALVTVRRQPGGLLSLQVNGKTDASTGGDLKTQMLTAHLPLLLHAGPRPPQRVLVIGLGSGVTLGSALSHPVARAEAVEISIDVVRAAELFAEANRGALSDPRGRVIVADARSWLMFHEQVQDVIASQPSNPWIAGQALLFTREYFQLARGRLAPGGLMCQWIQGYGLEARDFVSILATFLSVFPHATLWEESTAGGDYLIVGSPDPIDIDPRRIAERMGRPQVAADLSRAEIDGPADLLSHFVAGGDRLAALAAGAPLQTEDRLALEFTAPRSLRRDTLGGILLALEGHRADPSTLSPGDPVLSAELSRRALGARREREWARGLGLLERSGVPDAALLRALSYLQAGMRRHALETLRDLTLRRPSDRLPHLMLAHLLMTESGTGIPDAIRALRRAVALDPEEPRARLYLSRALFAGGRLDEALAENGRIRLPADGAARIAAAAASDRCGMLLSAGDAASAEAACLEALAADARMPEAHANLGLVRSRRGRPEEAEKAYRRALALDPTLADARFNLAALLERQGRARPGLETLEPLLEGPLPADADTLRLAARLCIQAGDDDTARAYVARSLALEPGSEESEAIMASLGRKKPDREGEAGPAPAPRSREEE